MLIVLQNCIASSLEKILAKSEYLERILMKILFYYS